MNPVSGNVAAMQCGESIAPWHSLSLEETAHRLGTDLQHGLAAVEADRRRGTYGSNLLREPPPEAWWWKLLRQFREVVIWILLVAALIAGAMGDWADTAAILAIVLLNAIIGFLQEERAQQALAALQRISTPVAKVVRDGELGQLPARELVPGDRIALEAGDHVPADARLIEAFGLRVQEASLTGESEPVEKAPGGPLPLPTKQGVTPRRRSCWPGRSPRLIWPPSPSGSAAARSDGSGLRACSTLRPPAPCSPGRTAGFQSMRVSGSRSYRPKCVSSVSLLSTFSDTAPAPPSHSSGSP